jgi:flavin-dependent dehydrogenase
VLGDAAGYVEPFTGEGMAWALAGAAAVEPLALAAVEGWRDELVDQWTARHAALIHPRQRACRALSTVLRHPRLVAALLALLDAAPVAVTPLTAWLNRDIELEPKGVR